MSKGGPGFSPATAPRLDDRRAPAQPALRAKYARAGDTKSLDAIEEWDREREVSAKAKHARADGERHAHAQALARTCEGVAPTDVVKALTTHKAKAAAVGSGLIQGADGEDLAKALVVPLTYPGGFKYEVRVGLSEGERSTVLAKIRETFRGTAEDQARVRGRQPLFTTMGNDTLSGEDNPKGVEAIRVGARYAPGKRPHVHGRLIEGVVNPQHGEFADARPGLCFADAPYLDDLRNKAWEIFGSQIQGELTDERWANAIVVGPRGGELHKAFLGPQSQWFNPDAAVVPSGTFYTAHRDCAQLFAEAGRLYEDDFAIAVFHLEGRASVSVESVVSSGDGSIQMTALVEKAVLEPGQVYAMDGRAGHAVRSSDNRICVIFRPLRTARIAPDRRRVLAAQIAEDEKAAREGRRPKLYWERPNRFA